MRTIAHVSDLHFGRHDAPVVEGLSRLITEANPDLVVISGDLTQRARTSEFKQARDFIQRIAAPVLVVPGNHDIPLFDIASRWLRPLLKYRRYVGDDIQPSFLDSEIAVVGINTARSLTWKNGRINERQMSRCCARLSEAPAAALRIVVTHHPFDLPVTSLGEAVIGRAPMAMAGLARCGVDVVLSGHFHASHTGSSATRYPTSGRQILLVQAGTATSTRRRGELNSCNLLHVEPAVLRIDSMLWNAENRGFEREATQEFRRSATGLARQIGSA